MVSFRGSLHSFSDLRRALTSQGVIIPNSGYGGMGYVFKVFLLSLCVRQLGSMYLASPNRKDLICLKDLIEAGKITPVIDRIYSLDDTPEACRYLERGHVRGKVVITMEHSSKA